MRLDELGHSFSCHIPGAWGGGGVMSEAVHRIPASALARWEERQEEPQAMSVPALEPHPLPMGPLNHNVWLMCISQL